jgi:surface protein
LKASFFLLILDVFLVNDHLVKKSSVRLNPGRQFFRALTVVYLVFGAAQHVAAQTPFVTTWQVDDISAPFVLPLQNHTPGNTYTIDWGDGSTDNTVYTETDTPTNLYTATGPYEISYSGNFTHLKFKDRSDLLGVVDWGSTQWTSMNKMFEGCSNFNQLPLDAPDLTFTEDLYGMFMNATSFNQDIGDWDVSNVTNMSFMFYRCSAFNQPIGNWGDKVANVTSMKDMFSHAHVFDQPLDSWDVGNVEDMSFLFNDAQRFNQDLNNWDVGNVKDMSYMFNKATKFNGNISAWVVDRVENMSRMFQNCKLFDQPINNWVVSSVTDMSYMFAKASIFNQSIGEWAEKVGSVADMSYMFNDARRFNQPLDSWDVGNVENMSFMFKNARRFNQPIGRWNVTRVSDMREMFADAIQFNADLSGWDVRGVTNMQGMFSDAEAFNTDVSTWDVSSVTNMAGMFSSARSFNQDLGSWDIRAVTDMAGMFGGVTLSKANYDATITGWVETAAAKSITLNSNVIFSGGNSKYCTCEPDRTYLINDLGWSISDGGKVETPEAGDDGSLSTCSNGATVNLFDSLNGTPDTGGTWSPALASGTGVFDPAVDVEGTYTYSVTGCGTNTAVVVVTVSDPDAPTIAISNSNNPAICGGNGTIDFSFTNVPDGDFDIDFDGGSFAAVTVVGNAASVNAAAGNYQNLSITVNGCTSTEEPDVTLSDPDAPTIAISNSNNPAICGGNGTIDFSFTNVPDGDHDIDFDGGSFPAVFVSANAASVNATAGAYNNLSIAVSGCLSSDDPSVSLSDPGTPLISLGTVSDPSTCAAADGAIQITGLIANTAYEIDYTDDGTAASVNLTSDASGFISIASLDAGSYTDITASLAGCESNSVGPVTLSDPAIPGIAAVGTDPSTCGGTDGSFEITGLDINTTYEISYTDDGTDVTANMTSNGEGSILVTDLNQGTYNNITATLSGCTSNAAGPVTLSDPGGECINEDFVTIWQVDDITTPFRLPKQGFLPEGKSYTIDWGDGTSDANTYTNVDVPTHSYSTAGAYEITYSGDFTQLRFEDRDDLLGVANWGNTQWTSMNSMFKGCSKFNNIPSTAPDLTFTNDLSNMLQGASSFNQSMANWDVSSITDMSALFYEAASFQGDISGWRVSNVTNMRAMFFRASAFDGDLSQWDVSQVEEMSYMFYNASAFAGDISSWNVSHVTDMSFMFYGAARFNGDLGNWNVANVTSMRAMFSSATNFPGGINNWNVSNVTDMRTMFSNAQSMSGSLDKWEVSSVTNMVAMFADALSFDGDIGSWDVASVVDMRNMFSGAEQFSSDISGWNVSAVSDMSYMFNGAIAFNADISDWNVFNVLDMTGMFNEASAFNRNLSGWCVGQINKEPTGFDAGTTAWTNPDWRPKWGVSCIPEGAFLSTWEVSEADLSVTVPVVPAVAYNYFVDWGDGYTSSRQTGNAVHTYSEAGTYTISIAGTFPRIYFNNRGDRNKIRFIDQWGDQRWSSMENAFAGCSKLQIAAVDAPNLKFVRNLRGMFKGATSLNSGLGHWDVSSATNMSDMFANTASFNGDVSEWNVGLVRDFSGMFRQATAFDQDLGNWDITNATKMDDMFEGVTLSTEHYDALLIGWAGLDAPPEGITFHGGSSTYCAGDDARKTLQLRHRWRITDGNRSTACILGIEGSLLSQVMLYPNPTQGIVHLQGWEEGKVRTVVIFDLSGRIVIKMDPSNQLNLEHLLEGTYILRLEGDQGLKTFKLIRN